MKEYENAIKNIQDISAKFCKNLEYFFTDIDDTITNNGLLPASSLNQIWKLHDSGIKVVLITGRPAGWCDHFARMWPIDGVIGENGAFYYSFDRKNLKFERVYYLSEQERLENRKKLNKVRERIIKEVPSCGIASDQDFRLFDLAIDCCEDVKRIKDKDFNKVFKILREENAMYKVSSIHINCWYGDYDKVSCLRKYLENKAGKSIKAMQEKIFFTGDSPNDEPIFKEMKYTGAVANINNFLDKLDFYPYFVASKDTSEGFKEIVNVILNKRKEDLPSIN